MGKSRGKSTGKRKSRDKRVREWEREESLIIHHFIGEASSLPGRVCVCVALEFIAEWTSERIKYWHIILCLLFYDRDLLAVTRVC